MPCYREELRIKLKVLKAALFIYLQLRASPQGQYHKERLLFPDKNDPAKIALRSSASRAR